MRESSGALTPRAPLTPSACHRSHQFSEVPLLLVEEGGVAQLHPKNCMFCVDWRLELELERVAVCEPVESEAVGARLGTAVGAAGHGEEPDGAAL